MKVWVVVQGIPYEGECVVLVCSEVEAAKAYVNMKEENYNAYWRVYEMELDKAEEFWKTVTFERDDYKEFLNRRKITKK